MSATHVSASLRRLVRERAGECCEYCLIPEAMTWALHTRYTELIHLAVFRMAPFPVDQSE